VTLSQTLVLLKLSNIPVILLVVQVLALSNCSGVSKKAPVTIIIIPIIPKVIFVVSISLCLCIKILFCHV